MDALELRVPPPIVALALGFLAWLVPGPALDFFGREILAIHAAALGLAIEIVAGLAFRKAGTTVRPWAPERSSALVIAGLYRFSRNPMYVGQALILTAWTLYLAGFAALLAVPAYVLYLNRFQIGPEERFLAAKFGAAYDSYRARVRRWV
jgi:protein-S-isoprenylcysteine O-methyltransferase Ste14